MMSDRYRTQRCAAGVGIMQSIGQLIRERRLALGMTQEQLEQRTGVSQTYISQIERGHTQRPEPATLRALSSVLGVPLRDLEIAAGWIVVETVIRDGVGIEVTGCLPARASSVPEEDDPMLVRVLPEMLAGAIDPFALIVETDEMLPWGIARGHYLIVDGDRQREPGDGDLVVVQTEGGETALRRWDVTERGVTLRTPDGTPWATFSAIAETGLQLIGVYVYHLPPLPRRREN